MPLLIVHSVVEMSEVNIKVLKRDVPTKNLVFVPEGGPPRCAFHAVFVFYL